MTYEARMKRVTLPCLVPITNFRLIRALHDVRVVSCEVCVMSDDMRVMSDDVRVVSDVG